MCFIHTIWELQSSILRLQEMIAGTMKKESCGVLHFSSKTFPISWSTMYELDDRDVQCSPLTRASQGEWNETKTIRDPFYVCIFRFIEKILIQVDVKKKRSDSANMITEPALT